MKTLGSLHVHILSIYFFFIFEEHHNFYYTIFTLKNTWIYCQRSKWHYIKRDKTDEKDTEEWELKKNLNNNLTYCSIQQNIEFAITLLLQRIQVFNILDAPYIEPL